VTDLSKSFGGLRAVSGVTFEVNAGEIVGIIGPNGAGKTTLFNVLSGVLPATDGTAALDGQSMLGKKVHQVCRMGVGRTFQVVRSFPRLPLLDNVIVGAYGAGLPDSGAIAAAAQALERVGLSDQARVTAGQLINKQLRLMELARALAESPRLLLLDETAGRPRPRRVQRSPGRARPPPPGGHDRGHHGAHDACDDAHRRSFRCAGSRPRPGQRVAARSGRGSQCDRGIPRQKMGG
jgi:ABC-type branched-subunit amino acid transport system ATPase component